MSWCLATTELGDIGPNQTGADVTLSITTREPGSSTFVVRRDAFVRNVLSEFGPIPFDRANITAGRISESAERTISSALAVISSQIDDLQFRASDEGARPW